MNSNKIHNTNTCNIKAMISMTINLSKSISVKYSVSCSRNKIGLQTIASKSLIDLNIFFFFFFF